MRWSLGWRRLCSPPDAQIHGPGHSAGIAHALFGRLDALGIAAGFGLQQALGRHIRGHEAGAAIHHNGVVNPELGLADIGLEHFQLKADARVSRRAMNSGSANARRLESGWVRSICSAAWWMLPDPPAIRRASGRAGKALRP
jgi:hypothetical protein